MAELKVAPTVGSGAGMTDSKEWLARERAAFKPAPRSGKGKIFRQVAKELGTLYRVPVRVRVHQAGWLMGVNMGILESARHQSDSSYVVWCTESFLQKAAPLTIRGGVAHEIAHRLLGYYLGWERKHSWALNHRELAAQRRQNHRDELAADAVATAMVGPQAMRELLNLVADEKDVYTHPARRVRLRVVDHTARRLGME